MLHTLILTIAALFSPDVDVCDVTPYGDVEISYDGALRVIDLDTGEELDGTICITDGAEVGLKGRLKIKIKLEPPPG